MTLAIHHVALNAVDPDDAARLYCEGAGFRTVECEGGTWLAGPNGYLQIAKAARPVGVRERNRRVCDAGITHICIQSGAGRALWDSLVAAGMRFNDAPVALGTGAIYAYGADGENNITEVEGVGDADPVAPPWIAHVALATPDIERLSAFYATLIGRPVHNRGRYANALFENITGLKDVDVCAAWIMADNLTFEMWQYVNPPTEQMQPPASDAPGWAHVAFAADDLDAEAVRLRDAGIDVAPTAFASLTGLEGADPDGNKFIVLARPPADHALSFERLAAPSFVADRNRSLLG